MKVYFLAAIALAMPAICSAQNDNIVTGPHQGAVTASLSGSFSSIDGDDTTNLNLFGSYFFTTVLEGMAGITYTNIGGDNLTGLSLGGNYYFMRSMNDPNMHPYVGIRFVRFDGGGSDADGLAGALGLHYFIRPNISFTPELVIGELDDQDYTTIQFGLTMWFR